MIRTRLVSCTRNKDKAAELLVELDEAPPFQFQMMVRGMCGVMMKGDMPLPARAFLEDRTHDETATKRTRAFFCQLMAELLGAVHDREGALAAVEEACACGLYDLLWLDRCPLLDEIRETERFQTARKEVEARSTAVVAILTGANSPTSATPS
jgi:serine/threonine-protein kinase